MQPTGFVVRSARWSAAHPWRALALWLAFVIACIVAGGMAGTVEINDSQEGNGDSARAQALTDGAGLAPPEQESLLVRTRDGSHLSAADLGAVHADAVARLQGLPDVEGLESPERSADGQAALITWTVPGDPDGASGRVDATLAATDAIQAAHPGLQIDEIGGGSVEKALDDTLGKDFEQAERLSLPITLLILVLAFGALIAAGVPVLLALSCVAAALGLTGIASHVVPMSESMSSVILLVGMAVGVDYSLFYLRRAREERARGAENRDAILVAAATSGRAVAISGLTVIAAMSGMFLSGNTIFEGFAIGTILVVAAAVLGSLVALPAVLSLFGDSVDRPRIPLLGRYRRADRESRVWAFVLRGVLARPVVALVLAGGALVVLALPTLTMNTRLLGDDDLPRSIPIMQTYDDLRVHFPDEGNEHEVVVRAADVRSPEMQSAIRDLVAEAKASGAFVAGAEPDVEVSADGTVAEIDLPYAGAADGATARRGLDLLRDDLVPATVGRVGAEAVVGGDTAFDRDFNGQLSQRLPLVFAFVLLLTLGLLLLTFRSLVVALTAIGLNVLSVLASYGLLVLVFQHSWAEGLLGFESNGAIVAWLPLFLFVILFGLSMDYHVFVLSRIREGVDRGMTTEDAVSWGIRSSAGVVTSAAVVMMGVFAIFATLTTLDMKQLGVGLAAAVLIDATIVRGVLLPATMRVLGDRNWYLPRALRWLPTVAHEAPPATPAAASGD
jgi:putative drug exporter of the RND superfamily